MKKILLRLVIVLVVLIVAAVVFVALSLDGLIKRGVETVGPKLTKVDVKLDRVHLSVLSGAGTIQGLRVGNPPGFQAPQAISVGSATLTLKPASVFSDKVVIQKIEVVAPEITLEFAVGGNTPGLVGNNLSRILANVNETTGGSGTNAAATPTATDGEKAGKKLQVDDFLISGAKVTVATAQLGGQSKTVAIPDIHLTGLGTGPEGITPGELLKRVLPIVVEESLKAAGTAFPELSQSLEKLNKALDKTASSGVSNLTKIAIQSSGSASNLTKSLIESSGGASNLTHGLDDLLKKK